MAIGITYVEMDVPRCTLTYGVAPCSAALGVTGSDYCFNSPGSCQVPLDFAPETMTLRWVTNSETSPVLSGQKPAIPSLLDVRTRPQEIRPGESLGRRERVSSTFKNHRHNDRDLDPYVDLRTYNPYEQGTYWGKFLARWPNPQGYPYRVFRGILNMLAANPLANLEVLHYEVDKCSLSRGEFNLEAVDGLKWLDDKRAVWPKPSNGILSLALSETDTALTLVPAGIGAEYPTSGEAAIGKEVVSFTRSGDSITLTGRALYGTEAKEHDAASTFQIIGQVEGTVANVFIQLLLETDTPFAYYDVIAWEAEANQFAPEIMQGKFLPTPINELVNRLIREMALTIFTDMARRKFVFRVMRPEIPTGNYNYDNGSNYAADRSSDQRIDSVYYRFGRFSPIDKFDEDKNYNGRLYFVDDNPQQAINQNPSAIENIYAVFVRPELRQTASVVSSILTERYNRVLRQVSFVTTREFAPPIGSVITVQIPEHEDASGANEPIPMQVISADVGEHQVTVICEEYVVNTGRNAEDGTSILSLNVDYYGANLRQLYNAARGSSPIPAGTAVIFDATGDRIIGGRVLNGNTLPALTLNAEDWPEVFNDGVTIEIRGVSILGKGGDSATVAPNVNGGPGGGALYTRVPVTLTNVLVGGGGGAGGAYYSTRSSGQYLGGGGGAGAPPGTGNPGAFTYSPATNTEGGDPHPYRTGMGGDLGEPGAPAWSTFDYHVNGAGGAPGYAINGLSYVTIAGSTTVLGPTSN